MASCTFGQAMDVSIMIHIRQGARRKNVIETNLKVSGNLIEEIEGYRNRLDASMTLRLQIDDRLEEDDAFVLLCMHLHQRFHEILEQQAGSKMS